MKSFTGSVQLLPTPPYVYHGISGPLSDSGSISRRDTTWKYRRRLLHSQKDEVMTVKWDTLSD
jgi:hypothetical protein